MCRYEEEMELEHESVADELGKCFPWVVDAIENASRKEQISTLKSDNEKKE